MVIYLAGPAAGFALFGVVVVIQVATDPAALPKYLSATLMFLYWMNLFWNLFSLLLVIPLDGGRVLREVCAILRVRNPDAVAHIVSVGVAVLMAVRGVAGFLNVRIPVVDDYLPAWLRPGMFMTMWFLLLAYENYQMYMIASRRYSPRFYDDDEDTPPWRQR